MCNFGANPDALRDPGLVAGEDNGLAYVAVWRARYDAQIYTNGAKNLGEELSREVSHAAAVEDWKHDAGKSDGAGLGNHSEEREQGEDHAESHGHAMISDMPRGDAGRIGSEGYPRDHESGCDSRRRGAGTLSGPNPLGA